MAAVATGGLCLVGGEQVEVLILGAVRPAWPRGMRISIGGRVGDRLAARSRRWHKAARPAASRSVAGEHGNGKQIGHDALLAQTQTRQALVPECVCR